MKIFILVLLVFLHTSDGSKSEPKPTVKTTAGSILGLKVVKPDVTYYSFKGIPYAEPPIGNLRFRAPVPRAPWTGIREAITHGSFCANKFGFFGLTQTAGGTEDCLFLNVYTPGLDNKKRAVMFWVHGGAFMSGNGDTLMYGPEHLIQEDVVLVTVNHRYSSFGFLSTGDENAPGNYGLKDLVVALQWVKANMRKFGGNPDHVTIFGHSAGSTACHFLVISDMAKGLFNRAILQSGTSLSECLFQPNPRPNAEAFGRKLGLTFSNTKELMDQLRSIDFNRIMEAETPLPLMGEPWAFRPFEFVPCVEPAASTEPKFLSKTPEEIMLEKSFQNISLMVGSPNFEGMFTIIVVGQPGLVDNYNQHPEYLAPTSFQLKEDSPQRASTIQALKNIYFGGNDTGTLEQWLHVYSDGIFRFHADRAVRMHAATKIKKVFYYQFSYDGKINFFKKLLNLNFPGASHGDELFYIFETELSGYVPDENDKLVRKRMTRMWANFAKYGNPTPTSTTDDLIPIQWAPYDNNQQFYMDINLDLEMRKRYLRMNEMSDLQQSLTGHY